jgi:hypothetical protein
LKRLQTTAPDIPVDCDRFQLYTAVLVLFLAVQEALQASEQMFLNSAVQFAHDPFQVMFTA